MSAPTEPAPSLPSHAVSAAEVADMFTSMTKVSVEFNRQLDLIGNAPHPLSQATVDALTRLLAIVAPAARTREQMALLPPPLLMDGIHEWLSRATPTDGTSAWQRASRAWSAADAR